MPPHRKPPSSNHPKSSTTTPSNLRQTHLLSANKSLTSIHAKPTRKDALPTKDWASASQPTLFTFGVTKTVPTLVTPPPTVPSKGRSRNDSPRPEKRRRLTPLWAIDIEDDEDKTIEGRLEMMEVEIEETQMVDLPAPRPATPEPTLPRTISNLRQDSIDINDNEDEEEDEDMNWTMQAHFMSSAGPNSRLQRTPKKPKGAVIPETRSPDHRIGEGRVCTVDQEALSSPTRRENVVVSKRMILDDDEDFLEPADPGQSSPPLKEPQSEGVTAVLSDPPPLYSPPPPLPKFPRNHIVPSSQWYENEESQPLYTQPTPTQLYCNSSNISHSSANSESDPLPPQRCFSRVTIIPDSYPSGTPISDLTPPEAERDVGFSQMRSESPKIMTDQPTSQQAERKEAAPVDNHHSHINEPSQLPRIFEVDDTDNKNPRRPSVSPITLVHIRNGGHLEHNDEELFKTPRQRTIEQLTRNDVMMRDITPTAGDIIKYEPESQACDAFVKEEPNDDGVRTPCQLTPNYHSPTNAIIPDNDEMEQDPSQTCNSFPYPQDPSDDEGEYIEFLPIKPESTTQPSDFFEFRPIRTQRPDSQWIRTLAADLNTDNKPSPPSQPPQPICPLNLLRCEHSDFKDMATSPVKSEFGTEVGFGEEESQFDLPSQPDATFNPAMEDDEVQFGLEMEPVETPILPITRDIGISRSSLPSPPLPTVSQMLPPLRPRPTQANEQEGGRWSVRMETNASQISAVDSEWQNHERMEMRYPLPTTSKSRWQPESFQNEIKESTEMTGGPVVERCLHKFMGKDRVEGRAVEESQISRSRPRFNKLTESQLLPASLMESFPLPPVGGSSQFDDGDGYAEDEDNDDPDRTQW